MYTLAFAKMASISTPFIKMVQCFQSIWDWHGIQELLDLRLDVLSERLRQEQERLRLEQALRVRKPDGMCKRLSLKPLM